VGKKKIDGHRHMAYLEAIEVAQKLDPEKSMNIYPAGLNKKSGEVNQEKGVAWDRKMCDFDENVADLKAAGMDLGLLQPTQSMFFYWADRDAAAELVRMVNEYTAQGVKAHPDNLLGLATLPLQHVDLAVEELTYCVDKLDMKGVAMGTNVNGHGFDEEQFGPFFQKVEELDIPIVVHPNDPSGIERVANYYLTNFLAYPMESAIFAAKLVFGGVFDRYPNLKICLSHAGGVLPFLLGRIEHGQSERPESREHCEHSFSHYLKNFYVDTITFRPDTLRFVLDIMPEGHVFMGTDYPYDMMDTDPVGSVKTAVEDENLQEKIMCENIGVMLGLT